jgi:hypothetical protein
MTTTSILAEPITMATAINASHRFHARSVAQRRPVAARSTHDVLDRVNAQIARHLDRRDQTAQVRLEMSRSTLNDTHNSYADLIAASILEVSDLSLRRTAIDIRISASAITITGSNPIDLPHADLCPDTVVLDHAEAAGLPVRLAWEQCMGPQLMIELTPGGFTLSRAFRLARDPGRVSGR